MNIKTIAISLFIGIVLVVSIFQMLQLNDIKKKISATGLVTGSGAIDTAGWTENEKMNYEMHGTIPARLGGSSGGMVGGC